MYRKMPIVFAIAISAWGQNIHAGLKLGVPFTQYFDTAGTGSLHGSASYSSATRRYTLGFSGEWRLTNAFGFEVDALYHRMGYAASVNSFDSASGSFSHSTFTVKGNSWDFPVMAKYRFARVIQPYVAGGGVLRHVGPVHALGEQTAGSLAANTSSTIPIDTSEPSDFRKRLYPGLTVAGGIELGAGRFRILPEFRYTRWTANIAGPGGVIRFAPNQAELIIGGLF
jgi:Outer membrane protein beta-barrel domain